MSEADKIKNKNFIIESIKSQNCKDVNIWFYKDKTIEIQDLKGEENIKYINMEILNKMYKTSKELGWIEE